MELLPKVGAYEFPVEPFHCDFSHQLFLGHLGNAMLNAADYHSRDRGYGMDYLNTIHKTWVLSRLAIEVSRMPKAYEQVKVETWVEGVKKFFTSRNFAVSTPGGQACAYGRSIWAMIDTTTRQPADIFAIRDGLIRQYVETQKPCPIAQPSRVKVDAGAPEVGAIETFYSDIDVNGHVNSVKYIEHILNLFPLDFYSTHRLQRFEIAYVAESHQGDRLHFYREESADGAYRVRVTKTERQNDASEVEVVRSYVKFVKE